MPRLIVATIATALLLPWLAAADAKTRFKIDSHYHYSGRPGFIEDTVRNCREYNMMVCLLTPYEAVDKIRQAVRDHPDVFIPYGSIDLDDPDAVSKIDRFYEAGFRGVGELTRPLENFDSPKYHPIYERLQLYGMLVLFHTGIVSRRNPEVPQLGSMDRMRPAYVDLIARRFPKLMIHIAHLGNPWYEEAAESLRWNPNMFSDVTGSSLQKKDSNPAFWGDILWWHPGLGNQHSPGGEHAFEKIVFGTDEGPEGLLPNIERFEKFLNANNVPEEVREKCYWGTMGRLLGIQPKRP